jgi:hypothetical protein
MLVGIYYGGGWDSSIGAVDIDTRRGRPMMSVGYLEPDLTWPGQAKLAGVVTYLHGSFRRSYGTTLTHARPHTRGGEWSGGSFGGSVRCGLV